MPVYKLPDGAKLPSGPIRESESRDPCLKWFRDAKRRFADVRSAWGGLDAATPTEKLRRLFEGVFPPELKDRIRFVGRGTTRVAFVTDTGICLKFQFNDWKDQSKQEIAEALAWPDLKCFSKLIDWSEDGLCMAYEVAEAPTGEDFVRTFSQGPAWIAEKLKEYAEDGESSMLDMLLDSGMLNPRQEESFRDLMKFQREMFLNQSRVLKDIDHADNWGLLRRDGQPVMVVTDFGV